MENKRQVEMIGTYSTFPEVNWAVIAQRSLSEARADAGVTELNRQALTFVSVVVLIAIIVGYLFAVAISRPIHGLAASTRAISRGEFHQRTKVQGRPKSANSPNFNKMAGDIEVHRETEKRRKPTRTLSWLDPCLPPQSKKIRTHAWSLAAWRIFHVDRPRARTLEEE
jgi:hypothetical protein